MSAAALDPSGGTFKRVDLPAVWQVHSLAGAGLRNCSGQDVDNTHKPRADLHRHET